MDKVLESQYTIGFIYKNYGLKTFRINNKVGMLSHENKILIPPFYSSIELSKCGYIVVSFNGKKTLFNFCGEQLLPFKYQDIYPTEFGLIPVSTNGKWGFLNEKLQEIVPTVYDLYDKDKSGTILINRNNKWGFINGYTGELIVPPIYDSIGYAGVIDRFEFPELPGDDPRVYSPSPHFNYGLASFKLNDKWGFIDTKGVIKIPPVWDWVDNLGFYTGVATVYRWERKFYIRKAFKKFYKMKAFKIDTSGKILCEIIELDAKS